jgi:hypothetical protein
MMRDMLGGQGCGADGANPLAKMLQGVAHPLPAGAPGRPLRRTHRALC